MEAHAFRKGVEDPYLCNVCGDREDVPIHQIRKGTSPQRSLAVAAKVFNASDGVADHDPVNRPSHYTVTKLSPLEVIEEWKLNYHRGQVLKYLGRAPYKGNELEDLKKAQWYLAREIVRLEETLCNLTKSKQG